MNNLNKPAKYFLFLTVLFFCLWLGGYVGRQLTVFRLFEPENMALKSMYNEVGLTQVINILLPVITYNLIMYPAFILSLILFLITSHINLKKEGWLFISVTIIFITLPFEVYLSTLDYELVSKILTGSFNSDKIVKILRERITILGSFPLIETFAYFAIIGLFLFKPLRKVQ